MDWEQRYRQLLWETHAGGTHMMALYGDDGEMQCNHPDCMVDFKRAPVETLDQHVWQLALKRARGSSVDITTYR